MLTGAPTAASATHDELTLPELAQALGRSPLHALLLAGCYAMDGFPRPTGAWPDLRWPRGEVEEWLRTFLPSSAATP